jgi:hypothetical protein
VAAGKIVELNEEVIQAHLGTVRRPRTRFQTRKRIG